MALLEIRDLSKSFGGIRAVDGCSFAVEQGSITALIGPNGAGKTTVFNLISGLHRPDSGAILFDGARIDGLPPHRITRKGIARTFQISRDLAELSVLENMVVQSPAGGLRASAAAEHVARGARARHGSPELRRHRRAGAASLPPGCPMARRS